MDLQPDQPVREMTIRGSRSLPPPAFRGLLQRADCGCAPHRVGPGPCWGGGVDIKKLVAQKLASDRGCPMNFSAFWRKRVVLTDVTRRLVQWR